MLNQYFYLPCSDVHLFTSFETQSKRLLEVVSLLSTASVILHPFAPCARLHIALPSDTHALTIIENLCLLLRCIETKHISLHNDWCKVLDNSPEKTEKMLRLLMNEAGQVSDRRWAKVAPVTLSDFTTLDVGRWLNDEVINYFIRKWCSRGGTTLGLNTFFACKILFQDHSCTSAKTGILTVADEKEAVKWCEKALNTLCLETWDSVFIPIHENLSHWYSAYINFRLKQIKIYDSLRDTCLANRQKPVLLRKNANLMLVLMWLTEVLGRMRNDPVCLTENGTAWAFDPHSKVHFQPNMYDCGVHTLWHLQHVLKFRQSMPMNPDPHSPDRPIKALHYAGRVQTNLVLYQFEKTTPSEDTGRNGSNSDLGEDETGLWLTGNNTAGRSIQETQLRYSTESSTGISWTPASSGHTGFMTSIVDPHLELYQRSPKLIEESEDERGSPLCSEFSVPILFPQHPSLPGSSYSSLSDWAVEGRKRVAATTNPVIHHARDQWVNRL
ncbi:hypothetical protein D9757_015287 [Collybiopsis confluens]|uniref:Ubiquitin-like protease family profile domain-containing protein n=1 Tax=Collybiopsis confluens TaxID=2823264 RepID=A0A8H5CJQ4_9AGAR|nr:hypothetical protein D9757_015287 [Collybiopsis confluens]